MKYLVSLFLVVGMLSGCCCNGDKQEKSCCKGGEKKECCEHHKDGKCQHDKSCCGKSHDGKCSKGCCMKAKPIIDNILTRVSVRQFTGDTISCKQIETLLKCAMAAPSAVNKQPWAFMVITEQSTIQKIGAKFPFSRCSNKPACVFVMCGDMKKVLEKNPDFWIHDVSAATENLLLAAHAMGLGAVWTGVFPDKDRVKEVQALLGIPTDIIPLCMVPVGVPAEQPEIKDKWKEENVHYNKW